jgi:signal transduction histidine kinase
MRAGKSFPIDIALVLKSSARLVAHQKRGVNINIKLEIEANLPFVNADEGQMQQAIIALATNAIDAMPGGGTLTFRASRKEIALSSKSRIADTALRPMICRRFLNRLSPPKKSAKARDSV